MTVQIFDNNTPGAPAASTAAGNLIAILDFVLVTNLGWTKPFSDTNKAVYKQPAGTNGFYLRVVDTGTTDQSPRARGYETMSDVDTGTGPFPTVAQETGDGVIFSKSQYASNGQWRCITDGKIFYLGFLMQTYVIWAWNIFGDFQSYLPGDQYNTVLMDSTDFNVIGHLNTARKAYIPRSIAQTGGAVAAGKTAGYDVYPSASLGGGNGISYPTPGYSGMLLSPIYLSDITPAMVRGVLPGIWNILHDTTLPAFVHGDTFDGTGNLLGRSFQIQLHDVSYRKFAVETSSTWGV